MLGIASKESVDTQIPMDAQMLDMMGMGYSILVSVPGTFHLIRGPMIRISLFVYKELMQRVGDTVAMRPTGFHAVRTRAGLDLKI